MNTGTSVCTMCANNFTSSSWTRFAVEKRFGAGRNDGKAMATIMATADTSRKEPGSTNHLPEPGWGEPPGHCRYSARTVG
jgi:hypothetical protein